MQNLDYAALKANETLHRSMASSIRHRVSECAAVPEDAVQVELLPGSIVVNMTITPPKNYSAAAVSSKLSGMSNFSAIFVDNVCAVPGIGTIAHTWFGTDDCRSSIRISHFRLALLVPTAPPTWDWADSWLFKMVYYVLLAAAVSYCLVGCGWLKPTRDFCKDTLRDQHSPRKMQLKYTSLADEMAAAGQDDDSGLPPTRHLSEIELLDPHVSVLNRAGSTQYPW